MSLHHYWHQMSVFDSPPTCYIRGLQLFSGFDCLDHKGLIVATFQDKLGISEDEFDDLQSLFQVLLTFIKDSSS